MTTVYSVYQINNYVKRMMDEDVFLAGFFVEAEISNFKEHSSGHLYFTLKDERAAINGVMFRSHAQGLEFKPENGVKVIAYGRVSAYEKTGAYQFYAELIQPLGLGGLFLAFSKLKAKLEQEGLFDVTRKKPIPRYPNCVGIVTSGNGAALRDIITVAGRRNPRVKLLIAPAAVQGAGASEEIAAAIRLLNTYGAADVIIVGRGGGSTEDLWAFNEEPVARAVAASRIPVVSAVGHETDYTICDFAADLRAPTPSAAAELCVPEAAETVEGVKWLVSRLNGAMEIYTDTRAECILALIRRMGRETGHRLSAAETRARAAIQALDAVAPLNVLKRGYALLYIDGSVVRTAAEAAGKPIGEMSVKLTDGTVCGEMTHVELNKTEARDAGKKEETDA
ncbi:MAG: exodeoxyribonuclease VII large subunit [Defluviitaleaceae bacterium]|nr:exodeoxyribonuclease VII large subunit [Defluviitaleaceae bacterium]MCL2836756.1 exodeoxyribonuclease VII large subunit [Defluviitaleaceae bacterium]